MEKCPICGGEARRCAFSNAASIGAKRTYHHCCECEHLFLLPVPAEQDLAAHYAAATTEVSRHYPRAYARRLHRLSKIIRPFLPGKPARYLEIGPGSIGVVPLLAKGDEYCAIEPGEENRRELSTALEKAGVLSAVFRSISEFEGAECHVAVIMSCLEHVRSPLQMLSEVSGHLAPGAILVFGSPRQDLEYADLGVLDGSISSNGDHLHSFSENSARALVEGAGFECLQMGSLSSAAYLRAVRALKRPLADYVRSNKILSAPVQLRATFALGVSAMLTAAVRLRGAADYDFVLVARKR